MLHKNTSMIKMFVFVSDDFFPICVVYFPRLQVLLLDVLKALDYKVFDGVSLNRMVYYSPDRVINRNRNS